MTPQTSNSKGKTKHKRTKNKCFCYRNKQSVTNTNRKKFLARIGAYTNCDFKANHSIKQLFKKKQEVGAAQ